ncbi:MAG: type I-C CRISPR-associated protein Cas8c/Csd1 [bacterium]
MTILQALNEFYSRLDKRGDAPKPGYEPVRIGFVLELSSDGEPIELIDIRDKTKKKPIAEKILMPAVSRTSGIKPAFLWDKTAYVFGVVGIEETDADGNKNIVPGQAKRTLKEHQAFVDAHAKALEGATDEGLIALGLFLQNWSSDQWQAYALPKEALDQNIAFRLQGDNKRIDQRQAAIELIESNQDFNTETSMCLVEGVEAPFAKNQPQFKGVIGAQSSGAPIVSFNSDAYESFGKSQGANAPVSERAAFRYGAALNWLLDKSNSRNFRIGEATVVFWADEKDVGEEEAQKVEVAWGEALAPPDKDADAEQADTIRSQLANVAAGRSAPDDSNLRPETRMHILALSPNAGRIAVRFWLVDTFGHLAGNLLQHEKDLTVEPSDFKGHPKAWALLYEVATQRKAENIPPRLGGELMQAILTGNRYPRTLMTGVIARIRADKQINGPRAALLKAVINRNIRKNNRDENMEGIAMALNRDSQDSAYNLGRLFAAYEYAERSVANRNATIKDKYIGAASATPRRVFPILMRGYEHNASKLAKGDANQRGSGTKAVKTISQILGLFNGEIEFPVSLKLEDQARFFVGYYHQYTDLYTSKKNTEQEERNQ